MRRTALALAFSIAASSAALAGPNLVTNGTFTSFTGPTNGGQIGYNVTLTGWSSPGYNFLYTPAPASISGTTADAGGALGAYGTVMLWGPDSTPASANGLTAPSSGNWVALDGGGPVTGLLEQTVTGLNPGDTYLLSFNWAAAQQDQSTDTQATTEQLQYALGGVTDSTTVIDNPGEGFTAGGVVTASFTATSSSELLSFLAIGTPSGVPPFALLSNVSLTDTTPVPTPEPAGLAVFGVALLGLSAYRLRRGA
jgi:hypothetical protein